MNRKRVLVVGLLLLPAALDGGRSVAGGQEQPSLAEVAFVIEFGGGNFDPPESGCGKMCVLAVGGDRPLYCGPGELYETNRLDGRAEFSVILGLGMPTLLWQGERNEQQCQVVHVWRRTGADWTSWEQQRVYTQDEMAPLGDIALLADDDTFLVSTAGVKPVQFPELPPYGVAKYRLSDIQPFRSDLGWEWQLGRRRGYLRLPQAAKLIFVTKDGRQAHIVTADGFVVTIDPASMSEIAERIQLQPEQPVSLKLPPRYGLIYNGDLTADERYLVTTGLTSESHFLNVADLVERRAWTLPLPAGQRVAKDLAINKGWLHPGLLAIHDEEDAVVYRFEPQGQLEELSRLGLERVPWLGHGERPVGPPIAWSGSGGELFVGVNKCDEPDPTLPICRSPERSPEFAVLRVEEGGRRLVRLYDVTVCPNMWGGGDTVNSPSEILTANGWLVPPVTPSSTPSPTPSPSASPTSEPSATATPLPTARPTATGTPPPGPKYLPMALRSSCQPWRKFADVALVLDASTSMRQPTSSGRSKLSAALEAATAFAELVSLRPNAQGQHDQLAIVAFHDQAWVLEPLTNDKAALGAALARIPDTVAEGTRLDLALERGLAVLTAPEHRAGNATVLILLTDGLPNRVPTPVPTGSQGDTVLGWARTVKNRGITVYTVGLGQPNSADPLQGIDMSLLRAVASRPEYFYHAPDGEDLAAIYAQIAPSLGCPPETGRP